jgi:hypothetical protein
MEWRQRTGTAASVLAPPQTMTTATIDCGTGAPAHTRELSASPRTARTVPGLVSVLGPPETVVFAVLATVGYVIAAWVFRYHFGYVVGDSLARSAKAVFMGVSRDPHFGAVGFYWPPLPSTLQIPLVLALEPFGRMDFAGPLSTALLTGGSIMIVGGICRFLGLGRFTSFVCCLFFAANPVIFVYAINGMSEACAYFCILVVLFAWLRWVGSRGVVDLALMGIAAAALVMTRVETFPMVFGLGIVAGAGRDARQWVARAVTVTLPAIVAMLAWMGTQMILLGDPLAFLHYSANGNPTSYTLGFRKEYDLPLHSGYLATIPWALAWVAVFAPVVVVCVVLGVARPRRHLYTTAGFACVAMVFPLVQMYLVAHQTGFGDPRYFTGMIPVGVVAVAYLVAVVRGTAPQAPPVFGALDVAAGDEAPDGPAPKPTRVRWVGSLAVASTLAITGAVSIWYMLPTNRTRIGDEHFVFQILLGRHVKSKDALGSTEQLADYLDPFQAKGQLVILDTNYAYAVDLFSRHPAKFIIPEDRDFLTTLENPGGKFQWIVAPVDAQATNGVPDQISPLISPPADWAKRGSYGDLVLWQYIGPATGNSDSAGGVPVTPAGG